MQYFIDKDGNIIDKSIDTWADRHENIVIDTFYGDHETHPSPESLKAAMKARNKRKKELKEKGFKDIECDRLIDDITYNPPKTTAYIVNAWEEVRPSKQSK